MHDLRSMKSFSGWVEGIENERSATESWIPTRPFLVPFYLSLQKGSKMFKKRDLSGIFGERKVKVNFVDSNSTKLRNKRQKLC